MTEGDWWSVRVDIGDNLHFAGQAMKDEKYGEALLYLELAKRYLEKLFQLAREKRMS